MDTVSRTQLFMNALAERILILDGATGTMLQKQGLTEADFRTGFFEDHAVDLKGNNDVLPLTKPAALETVHRLYLDAGADIIETDTFGANAVTQEEYGLADFVYEMNRAGAAVARKVADEFTAATPAKPRFVAGSIGPTGKTLSMSPDVNDPGARALSFDRLADAYRTQVCGLLDGGADVLLIETVFDTLNAKAAIAAILRVGRERGIAPPVMISGTVSDAAGRLLSGQNVEAFLISVLHTPNLVSIGFNCALGAAEMRPHIAELARKAPCRVSAHPNAGLPDELGRYRQSPSEMASILRDFADSGLLNIAGGCCGTNPDHIRAIAETLRGVPPRKIPVLPRVFKLSGLDPLVANREVPFLNVGERTNVAGSRKFLNLIKAGNLPEALRIARSQVENGAQIIDVNMDDAMLDPEARMCEFLLNAASEPDIARVPVMLDSSRWNVLEAGLKCVQGKCVVNSLSLKEGEAVFLERARKARDFGAAILAMAFDENGQADTITRRVEVCSRMYRLLTEQAGVPPEDIIFDPNVFAVATGMPEHDSCASDFIEAVRLIRAKMPDCHISGGISNVSFSFRGNEPVRAAMHSVFLFHAIRAGLDMGIVNPAQLALYEELDPVLRDAAEDVILNRRPGAAETLLALASGFRGNAVVPDAGQVPAWRADPLEKRLEFSLVKGNDAYLKEDMAEALAKYGEPVRIVEGPLMDAMKQVGVLFGAGKMFLPQVVKTARVMKQAVSYLVPDSGSAEPAATAGTIVLATVKGDVHDIGKNIVAVVLRCNGFRVIDLGVMVPCAEIVDAAEREHADIVALSGLITPSLEEMAGVARELGRRGLSIPLMVGGATTSKLHTALKLQPLYSAPVVHTHDASETVPVALALVGTRRAAFESALALEYDAIRAEADAVPPKELLSYEAALAKGMMARPDHALDGTRDLFPDTDEVRSFEFSLSEMWADFNRAEFAATWRIRGRTPNAPEAKDELLADAASLIEPYLSRGDVKAKAVAGVFCAVPDRDDIRLTNAASRLPMLRQQTADSPCRSLSDCVAEGRVGAFVLTVSGMREIADAFRAQGDDYRALLAETLSDHFAESAAVLLQNRIAATLWPGFSGIRPAIGFPICPDHSLKRDLFKLLHASELLGVTLTESCMMTPSSSVCGLFLGDSSTSYFTVGPIGDDQLADYAKRRETTPDALMPLLASR